VTRDHSIAPAPENLTVQCIERRPTDCFDNGGFDSPFVGNGDAGMTFCGPANFTTFYLASNSFWNSNMNVDMRPSQSKGDAKGDGESYSTLRIGDLGLIVP
jgi:hypothetical protein